MDHLIDAELLNHRVQVHLVGVGGNGAQMAACLARLDIAMKALGHPCGLHVKAFDRDRVSEANVGRQLYSRADVGHFKSVVTIHRLNQFYGLDWDAYPFRYEEYPRSGYCGLDGDIVVSCVDTRSARRGIHARLSNSIQTATTGWIWGIRKRRRTAFSGSRRTRVRASSARTRRAYRASLSFFPNFWTMRFPTTIDHRVRCGCR